MQIARVKGFHLSLQQARLWSWRQESQAYQAQCALLIEGPLHVARFEQALDHVIDRHGILRTTFRMLPGMEVPLQVVLAHEEKICSVISLEMLAAKEQTCQLEEQFTRSVEGADVLVLRAMLFRLSTEIHVFLVRVPTLCADSRTLTLLVEEVFQRYEEDGQLDGQDDDPLQYVDVAAWQEELLQEEEAQEAQAYWQHLGLAEMERQRLPFARRAFSTEPGKDQFQPCRQEWELEPEIVQQVEALAQAAGVTMEAVLLASWQLLLWRFLEQTDLVLGVCCDGRPYEELSTAFGLYSRVVPFKTAISAHVSFGRYLTLVHASLEQARNAQLYFTWGAEDLAQSCESSSYLPLCFEFVSWPAELMAGGLRGTLLEVSCYHEPFALKLLALQVGSRLRLQMHYDPHRFSPEQIATLSRSFQTLLQQAFVSAQTALGTLPLLSVAEQQRLIQRGRGPEEPFVFQGLIQRFEAQVVRHPQRLAARCGEEALSYQELEWQSNQLAHALCACGVEPGMLVALYLERSLLHLVALLAVLKVGAGYVPLDPEQPVARVQAMLNELPDGWLVTQEQLHGRLNGRAGRCLCLDGPAANWREETKGPLDTERAPDPEEITYVIYTSGSTGEPKGVMIRQGSVSNYIQAVCARLQAQPGWQWASVSTLAADLGNTQLFGALASGGGIHLVPSEVALHGEALGQYLRTQQIDVLKLVPSHLLAVLESGLTEGPRQWLLLGGEALRVELVQRVRELGGTCRVMNHYGPTESTIGAVVEEVGALESVPAREELVPIGRPIANLRGSVLDERQQVVPVGMVGELYLGGAGLGRGYLGRPEQTAERWVPDPYGEEEGARLYRTGDRVRAREDGRLEYVGRSDRQVKLRGYRIELGEIETILTRHPAVRESVVLLREDAGVEKRLVAYVVSRPPVPSSSALRTYLTEHVPAYMVPAAFIFLSTLPLTPNGKLDLLHMPAPKDDERKGQVISAVPRSPVEKIIAEIWEDVLRVKPISIHDSFAELGGHSLLATQIISRLRTMLQIEISLRSLFDASSIAGLTKHVEQFLSVEHKDEMPPLIPVSRQQDLPLSFAQQRLWFLDQLEPESTVYNIPRAMQMQGALDIAALDRSLKEVVRRHESLRTTFQVMNDQPIQVIVSPEGFSLPLIDLSTLDLQSQEMQVRALTRQEAHMPFNLARGLLFRATVLRLGVEKHGLLLTMHHIVSDGWSRNILEREVSSLYNAFVTGESASLSELPIQYADYAVWQREWLSGEVLADQMHYWLEQLRGLSPLNLPTDYPRPPVQTFHGARESLLLPADIYAGLNSLSRREGVTLFMMLLAALQVLLARYSEQDDITVGTPIANRTHAETEGLIGFFVNTLVLRTDLSGNPRFVTLLKQVRETCLNAYAHQDVPFEQLVEQLQTERDLSRSPLFQVMFSLQTASSVIEELEGLRLSRLNTEYTATKFDLTFTARSDAENLFFVIEYNTDIFEASTIQRLAEHWHILLGGIVATPEVTVADLPVISEEERYRLLSDWNQTQIIPATSCIHELFEQQVMSTPDAVALIYEDEQISYSLLNILANRLAHFLYHLRISPEERVGICLERSVYLPIAVLGILKAGGAYVPLDPSHPSDRIAFIVADAHVSVVITIRDLAILVQKACENITSICLDDDVFELEAQAPKNLNLPMDVESLAYVIYTSGSSGKPKGVLIPHANVVRLFSGTHDMFHFQAEDVWSLFHSYSFDFSVWELWGALLYGARLVIVPYWVSRSPDVFYELLARQRVSVLNQTPSAFYALMEVDALQSSMDLSLRLVIFGGEALEMAQLRRWVGRHGDQQPQLINMYGITETTVHVTYYPITLKDMDLIHRSVIGVAIQDLSLYVLDAYQRLVPIGVPGELYVGGEGVARGYISHAELTAERFVPDPFSFQAGARLYRTGDRVRYTANGQMEYIGRIDQQVKMRGYRIELGEIEAALVRHPLVHEAVVMLREDTAFDKRLSAYVVILDETNFLSSEALRRYLQEILPDYMVPADFVTVDGLPLTSNGKVDRRALLKIGIRQDENLAFSVQERSPLEALIADIWRDVLRTSVVDIHDNFFAVGGHSLLATQVVSRIRTIVRIDLPLRTLFESPSIAELAERVIQAQRGDEQGSERPSLVPVMRDKELPLSFAQQRLWFLDQLEPGNVTYIIPNALYLMGRLDTVVLERSLEEIIWRHESLRTTFSLRGDNPVQIVVSPAVIRLALIDLSGLGLQQREREERKVARQEAQRAFDLAHGPLFRACLLCLEAEKHLLLLTMHHIVSDGWSMGIIVREVSRLYNAFVAGEPSPLSMLPIQYVDFAVWQREWLRGEVLDAQLAYWTAHLQDLTALDLPTDYMRPPVQSARGARESLLLPVELSDAIKKLSRREGVTLFMTLLAAFQVLLAHYSGQDDITVGTDIANRTQTETEGLVGFFVNTLVLRTDLSGNPTFLQLLQRVREVCLGAYAHQDVPFEKIVEALQPERDLSRSPLFQAMLSLQAGDSTSQAQPFQGLGVQRLSQESASAKFDIMLTVSDAMQGLYCQLEYSTDLFEASTIKRLLGHWQTLLSGIQSHPESPIMALPLLSEAEQFHLLVTLNEKQKEQPLLTSLLTLFGLQVVRIPDSIALLCEEEQLSYIELDRRADRLAHHLQRQGVGLDVLVGLYMERSIDMVVGILAIFKAGGAYVPLDPAYPQERLAFILADAHISLLLTTVDFSALASSYSALLVQVEQVWKMPKISEEMIGVDAHSSSDLAYVIYTSGSTGLPKGAMVTQAGMLNHLLAKIEDLELQESDRIAQTASHCFDISVWQCLAPLLIGGQVHIFRDEVAHDPQFLLKHVQMEECTILELVPSLLRLLLDEVEQTEFEMRKILPLRWLVVTGEALPPYLCQRWWQWYPQIPLVNAFGPTECSDDVTHALLGLSLPAGRARVPIGRAIRNTQVYLLNENYAPVPVGVPGQIYVGGIGVGRGYLNNPIQTAERFIPDLFSEHDGVRLYCTGDVGRYLADGQVEFLGRVDQQVKVRGYRIELGEIEEVLAQHPQVRENCVVDWQVAEEIRLIAYVIAREGAQITGKELRAYVQGKLPEYMQPSEWVLLEVLPLNANGKVDRQALPEPGRAEKRDAMEAETREPLQELVSMVWRDVLGREDVGLHDNFFALGGHSLLATQVIARLRASLRIELALRSLFEAPTMLQFTSRVEQALRTDQESIAPPLVPVSRAQNLPLSFAQQRLWFLDQLYPGNSAYNIPNAVHLQGILNLAGLEHSLEELIRRHESLRTTFHLLDGSPIQVISAYEHVSFPLVDLSILSSQEREEEMQRLAEQEAARSFHLGSGPLWRTTLLRADDEEHVLLLTMHHIVSDGWSMGLVVREITHQYNAFMAGAPSPLSALPVQYADYAVWQREWLQGEVLAHQLTYWRAQLRGVQALRLPTDHPRPAVQSYRGARLTFQLPLSLTQGLLALSRQEGVTLFMTVLAAFQCLLFRLSGQNDIVVGTDIAHRTQVETEALIGFFINLLALRSQLDGSSTYRELLAQVRETVLGAYLHQDAPFEMLVEELEPGQRLDRMPVVQVLLVMQNVPAGGGERLQGLEARTIGHDVTSAKFDLALFLQEGSEGLQGRVIYSTDLYEAGTIETMMKRFEHLLQEVVAQPDIPLNLLTIALDTEKEQQAAEKKARQKELRIAKGERIDLSTMKE